MNKRFFQDNVMTDFYRLSNNEKKINNLKYKSVDYLLDYYNDYMVLYDMWGDRRYLDHAERAMKELKSRS